MSSYPDSAYLAVHRSTVHPLLAALTPMLFLACLDAAARHVLPPLPYSPFALFVMLALTAAEEAAMGNLLREERAGFAARLRELAVILALAYAAAAVIASLKSGALVTGRPDFAYPVLFVFLQWTLGAGIHAALRERELLLSAIQGRRGEELLHRLRESSLQAGLSLGGLRSLKILAIAFQILVFLVLLALLGLKARVAGWEILPFAAHAVYGAFVVGLVNAYRDSQLLLGEGIVVPPKLEVSRIGAAAVLLAASLPLVLLGSRNESPLSLGILSSLLAWIDRHMPRLQYTTVAEGVRRYLEVQRATQERLLSVMRAAPPSPAALFFFELLRRLLASAAGAALYFFLVSPLFSEEFVDGLARRSLPDFLRRKLRAFLRFWAGALPALTAWLGSIWRWRRPAARGPERTRGHGAGRGLTRSPSLRKRRQTDRVLKAFFTVVEWGERHGVSYRDSDTPKQYARRLVPELQDGLPRLSFIVDVMEESVFSTHLLEPGRLAAYFAAVRLVRKTA